MTLKPLMDRLIVFTFKSKRLWRRSLKLWWWCFVFLFRVGVWLFFTAAVGEPWNNYRSYQPLPIRLAEDYRECCKDLSRHPDFYCSRNDGHLKVAQMSKNRLWQVTAQRDKKRKPAYIFHIIFDNHYFVALVWWYSSESGVMLLFF